jgi:hypothetical protein
MRSAPALVCSLALSLAGCNLNKMAADTTADVAKAGADGINGFWDYDIAGAAMPGVIMQSEALVAVSPDNPELLVGLAKTYVAYAYGWVQDEWEIADEKGQFERADRLEERVRLMYDRAAKLALRALRLRDDHDQLDEKLATGKVEVVKAYLADVFKDKEDVGPLYYAGLAWGSTIANSGGDLAELAKAPVARLLLERSVELDPTYNDAGGLGVLASVEAMFPALFGGDPSKSKDLYEKAIALSDRKNHLILLGYARNYAVNTQNRELFLSLINEILSAPDTGTDLRLSNKVARHRAERYIKHVDEWFDPALAPAGAPDGAAAEGPAAER